MKWYKHRVDICSDNSLSLNEYGAFTFIEDIIFKSGKPVYIGHLPREISDTTINKLVSIGLLQKNKDNLASQWVIDQLLALEVIREKDKIRKKEKRSPYGNRSGQTSGSPDGKQSGQGDGSPDGNNIGSIDGQKEGGTIGGILSNISNSPEKQSELVEVKSIDFQEEFEKFWRSYPKKEGKSKANKKFLATVKTEKDLKEIKSALKSYIATVEEDKKTGFNRRYKQGSTWMNSWRDYVVEESPVCSGEQQREAKTEWERIQGFDWSEEHRLRWMKDKYGEEIASVVCGL